jgi:hypothetical protein
VFTGRPAQESSNLAFGHEFFQRDQKSLLSKMRSITAEGKRREEEALAQEERRVLQLSSQALTMNSQLQQLMLNQLYATVGGCTWTQPGQMSLPHANPMIQSPMPFRDTTATSASQVPSLSQVPALPQVDAHTQQPMDLMQLIAPHHVPPPSEGDNMQQALLSMLSGQTPQQQVSLENQFVRPYIDSNPGGVADLTHQNTSAFLERAGGSIDMGAIEFSPFLPLQTCPPPPPPPPHS